MHIRHIDEGTGNSGTVVLLHGISPRSYMFHRSITELVLASYWVIAPNLLGHGFSNRKDCFDRSFQDQARMVPAQPGLSRVDLVAVIDWQSRRVLSWWVSNTLDTHFCIDALE